MRTTAVLLGCVGLSWLLPSGAAAQPSDPAKWLLFVAQDESSTEKKIARYIEEVDGVEANLKFLGRDDDDLALIYTLKPKSAPTVKCSIDTQPSNREGDKVKERVIFITVAYVLPPAMKTQAKRAQLLETIGAFMRSRWAPDRVYIDGDGDLALRTIVNIPGPTTPVHAEMVRDSIQRLLTAWDDLFKTLEEEFGSSNFPNPK